MSETLHDVLSLSLPQGCMDQDDSGCETRVLEDKEEKRAGDEEEM